jgi:hypothetical protein
MSRWIDALAVRIVERARICVMIRTMSAVVKRSFASKQALSSRPWTNSIAMYQMPSSSPQS